MNPDEQIRAKAAFDLAISAIKIESPDVVVQKNTETTVELIWNGFLVGKTLVPKIEFDLSNGEQIIDNEYLYYAFPIKDNIQK